MVRGLRSKLSPKEYMNHHLHRSEHAQGGCCYLLELPGLRPWLVEKIRVQGFRL